MSRKAHEGQMSKRLELLPVSLAWSTLEYCYSPRQDASPSRGYAPEVCHRYPFINLDEERQWIKVPCLRKQCDGWGLNPGSPEREFKVLTTQPHMPPEGNNPIIFGYCPSSLNFMVFALESLFGGPLTLPWAKSETVIVPHTFRWTLKIIGEQ